MTGRGVPVTKLQGHVAQNPECLMANYMFQFQSVYSVHENELKFDIQLLFGGIHFSNFFVIHDLRNAFVGEKCFNKERL